MLNNLKIRYKLALLVGVLILIALVEGLLGLNGMERSNSHLKTVYEDRTVALTLLGDIQEQMFQIRANVLKAALVDTPELTAKSLEAASNAEAAMQKNWKAYMATYLIAEENTLAGQFEENWKAYQAVRSENIALIKTDRSAAVPKIMAGGNDTFERANSSLKQLTTLQATVAKQEYTEAHQDYERTHTVSLLALVLGALLGAGLALLIIRSITRPLEQAQMVAAKIADGDLSSVLPPGGKDEIGLLLGSLGSMQQQLREMVQDILSNVEQISSASEQLASSSAQVAQRSSQQSEASASMAASIEEMTVSVDQINERARETLNTSTRSGELARQGAQVIQRSASEMRTISDSVLESARIIADLGEQSQRISTIIGVIKEIADQTNLLALNAAIEAARAGEQGRGFSVVADEVRKLAERTTQSTQEIATMINDIVHGAQQAVISMEKGESQVEQGVALANEAGDAIVAITEGSVRVVQAVNDISAALREQSIASNDIAKHVEKIAQMTDENSAVVHETSIATQHLDQLAAGLHRSVSRFRLQ